MPPASKKRCTESGAQAVPALKDELVDAVKLELKAVKDELVDAVKLELKAEKDALQDALCASQRELGNNVKAELDALKKELVAECAEGIAAAVKKELCAVKLEVEEAAGRQGRMLGEVDKTAKEAVQQCSSCIDHSVTLAKECDQRFSDVESALNAIHNNIRNLINAYNEN